MMKRLLPRLVSLALCLTFLTGLFPAALAASPANYDIYVNAKDGLGLNIRSGPGTEYDRLRSDLIPMYTKLHISQTTQSDAGLPWGYTSYDGTSGWVCLVETTTYDPSSSQSVQPTPVDTVDAGDPLASIAYLGDRSQCRMDAAMAQAYREALLSLPILTQYGGQLHAALVDVAGDGYPLLFTVYWYDNPDFANECGDPAIWEYREGKAVARDLKSDCGDFSSSPIQFAVDTIQEGPVFRADANGGGGVDPVQGSLYYTVSQGQMTLCHTHVHYTMENQHILDGETCADYDAVLAQLGQTDSPANRDLTMNGSTLFLECSTSAYDVMAAALEAYGANAASQGAPPDEAQPDASPADANGLDDPESSATPTALVIIIVLLAAILIVLIVLVAKRKKNP